MADAPEPRVEFTGGCPDPGRRHVQLPRPLPDVGDDFDWQTRDFEGFRRFMLEELAAQHPERRRWTAADFEVVIVEALAVVLDQLSDMADRVAAEAFLQTARQPESVRRLLSFIGHEVEPLETEGGRDVWLREPWRMEAARRAGPQNIHRLERMVTLDDHRIILERHPLVLRASAWSEWNGAWEEIKVAVVGHENMLLDQTLDSQMPASSKDEPVERLLEQINETHEQRRLPHVDRLMTPRTALSWWIDIHRMLAQQVTLVDARHVGVVLGVRVHLLSTYFRSEVRDAIEAALGEDGFFRPGRLEFGADLHISQLVSLLQRLPGVARADVTALHRVGGQPSEAAIPDDLRLDGLELAVCDNDPGAPERGWWKIEMCGGRAG